MDILSHIRRAASTVLTLILVAFLCVSAVARPHPGVKYAKVKRAGIHAHVVDIDLKRDDLVVRPVVAPNGHRPSFKSMVQKHRPAAAINGTFYDTNTGITIGNLVSEGRLLSEGMVGSNLAFLKDGSFQLISSSRNLGRYKDWSQVDFAIGGGPTLISGGEFFMDPRSEGFRDPSLFAARPRTAVGVTSTGHLLMVVVTQSVTLWQLAHTMKELNCVHAINLDGGSSSALSIGQKQVVRPQRGMTNILGVFYKHMEPTQKRAVQVAQSRARAHFQKGQALMKKGKPRLGRSQIRQAVAKDPGQAGYWKAAGIAELAMGNSERAVLDLQTASDIYAKRGKMDESFKIAQTILTVRPKNVSAHLLCGEVELRRGHHDVAKAHIKQVLDAHPGHPKASRLWELVNVRFRAFQQLQGPVKAVAQVFGS